MIEFIKKAAGERLAGGRPSVPRALVVATAAGVAAGAMTYRLLRS